MTPVADRARATDARLPAELRLELAELMARYTRRVDALAFDRLGDVLLDDAEVHYAWRPVGAAEHETMDLIGLPAVQAWLSASLSGRADLRRYVSNLDLLAYSADEASASVRMHERGMRISGLYRFDAVRGPAGWRLRRLRLREEIHWA